MDQLRQIFKELDAAISERVSEIALEIHGELVDNPPTGTPVDTGWASVNWWPRIGSPATENGGPVGETGSRLAGQLQGVAALAGFDYTVGLPIHITNNVPYIGRLNDGSSTQSPAGFVDDAVNTVLVTYRNKPL